MFVVAKILITALLIVIITEIAKLNDRIGALIAALPITTFLILFWLHFENNSIEKISNHVSYTLLYVLIQLQYVFPKQELLVCVQGRIGSHNDLLSNSVS